MTEPAERPPAIERAIERTIFASRWLLAPFYLGLTLSLVALVVKFVERTVALLVGAFTTGSDGMIVAILSLIDLSLVANLVLMVVFAGYESFVSRLDVGDARRLDWMGQVGFGDLKLKIMASIVAITAIHLLEVFMEIDHVTDRVLMWTVGIHLVFVVSAVLLAWMDRLSGGSKGDATPTANPDP